MSGNITWATWPKTYGEMIQILTKKQLDKMSLYRKEYLTYIGYSPVYKYLPNYNDHSKDISKLPM